MTKRNEEPTPASAGSAQHTPGPWVVGDTYEAGRGLTIRQPLCWFGIAEVKGIGPVSKRDVANATLIAAAPELLGSLTELLKAIGASDIELNRHGLVAAVQRAVLAINVATNAR